MEVKAVRLPDPTGTEERPPRPVQLREEEEEEEVKDEEEKEGDEDGE